MPTAPPETIPLADGVLTRVRAADADGYADAVRASLDHLRPWLPWAGPAATDPAGQRERCADAERQWDEGSEYLWTLREDPAGPVIGTIGLHRRVGPRAMEIGYWVHVDHIGRGHARAAAAAVTSLALSMPDVDRVEIHTAEANVRSAAVPRALGYRLDRVDAGPPEMRPEAGGLQVWVRP